MGLPRPPRTPKTPNLSAAPSEDPILGPEEEVEAELEAGPADSDSVNEDLGDDAPGSPELNGGSESSAGETTGQSNGLPKAGIGTKKIGGKSEGEKVPTGEVVGILQRALRDYVACLQKDDEESLGESGGTPLVLTDSFSSASFSASSVVPDQGLGNCICGLRFGGQENFYEGTPSLMVEFTKMLFALSFHFAVNFSVNTWQDKQGDPLPLQG